MASRVLVVDDEPTIRMILSRYLGRKNYEVIEASDAKEAMQAFADSDPDLVLLDVNLGADNGLDVLAAIRETSSVPVLLCTGMAAEPTRSASASGYVVKPFSAPEVEAQIAELLGRV